MVHGLARMEPATSQDEAKVEKPDLLTEAQAIDKIMEIVRKNMTPGVVRAMSNQHGEAEVNFGIQNALSKAARYHGR